MASLREARGDVSGVASPLAPRMALGDLSSGTVSPPGGESMALGQPLSLSAEEWMSTELTLVALTLVAIWRTHHLREFHHVYLGLLVSLCGYFWGPWVTLAG